MRCLLALVFAGTLGLAAGCGSAHTQAPAAARVEFGTCKSVAAAGRPVSQSCEFALSNGQQFRCRDAFEGRTPSAGELERTRGCVAMPSLKLSSAVRALITALDRGRGCLTSKGLRVVGGAVLPPSPHDSPTPDGELTVVGVQHPTFIAFYIDAAKAKRLEPAVQRNARQAHGAVERRGAVTIVWSHAPTSTLRSTVEECVFR